jgi:dTDP-4-dehydrorhamnose reductase
MKILITGGTGQLGRDCTSVLENGHEIFSVASRDLDISDGMAVEVFVQGLAPDVILNCAAFTRVDDCETAKALAWKVNVEGPRYLAAAAQASKARMIHISTDYVFDGKKPIPDPYTENDKTHPLSHYGLTKLEGEKAVCGETDRYTIIRTAWLYGAHGGNFLKTMLRLTLNDPHKTIQVVHDQFGSPTWSYRLAEQIERVMAEMRTAYIPCHIPRVLYLVRPGRHAFLDEMGIPKRHCSLHHP